MTALFVVFSMSPLNEFYDVLFLSMCDVFQDVFHLPTSLAHNS